MDKKYILTDNTIFFAGSTLHRIQAIRDFRNVHAGDLGGWIEDEHNLSHDGDCWIYDDAIACENASVYKDACLYVNSDIHGKANICGKAKLYDNVIMSGNSFAAGESTIFDDVCIYDQARIVGKVIICCLGIISGNAQIIENAKISIPNIISGNTVLGKNALINEKTDYFTLDNIGEFGESYTFYLGEDENIYLASRNFNDKIEKFINAIDNDFEDVYKKQKLAAVELSQKWFEE